MELWLYLTIMGVFFLVLVFFFFRQIWGPHRIENLAKLLDTGQYKRVIKEAQFLLKKNERNHRAQWLLADAYFRSKEMDQALNALRLLTKLNRYDDLVREEEVRNRLAEVFLHFGQLEEAQKEFLLIARLNPSNYEILYKIAKIFFDRNYMDNALAYFMRVINLNNKHAESHYYVGIVLYQAKKENEALVYLNNAIKYDAKMHCASYYLGLINKGNNNFHQAIQHMEDAQKDPEFRQKARLIKGQCFFEMGDTSKAILEFERALKDVAEEDNVSLAIRYSLAGCYEAIRDLPSAIEQWEKIASYKPSYNDVLEKLSTYQELRTDDHLKDFLTASNQVFEQMCRELVMAMGFDIVKFSSTNGNHAVVLATEPESKWRNAKVSNKLIHIFREAAPVQEPVVRQMLEECKKVNATKVICITSTKFSPGAREFASARPIDLIDKQGLAKLLKNI